MFYSVHTCTCIFIADYHIIICVDCMELHSKVTFWTCRITKTYFGLEYAANIFDLLGFTIKSVGCLNLQMDFAAKVMTFDCYSLCLLIWTVF